MLFRFALVKCMGYKLGLLGMLWFGLNLSANAQKMNVCEIYGTVYVTKNPKEADFVVFVEDTEAFSDLVIYREENKLYADQKGLWYYTDAIDFAQYVIFLTDNKDFADFSIFYIDTPAFAGCR